MSGNGENIRLTSRDGFSFGAYRSAPTGPRKAGVIVVQEIFGLSSHIREMADRFAAAGFEAIAPSMYDRAAPGYVVEPEAIGGAVARSRELAVGNGQDNAMNDIGACLDRLASDGPVFVTGYCYGGTMSWLAASRLAGLAGASCYYGGQILQMSQLPLGCPVSCHFGRTDAHIPEDQVKAMAAARPEVAVYLYEAGHGFSRRNSPDYDVASDELAFSRTIDQFTRALS